MKPILPILTFFCACCIAWSGEDGKPASTNAPNAEYPRILSDNRVVFRVEAPNAATVAFQTDKEYPATRNADGFWTATTDPQVPGFHYYWLVIDGVRVNDPGSETFYGTGKQTSGIEIPEPGSEGAYYEPQDVPQGEIRERWYHSTITGQFRRFFIYTPPGYDNSDTRYPVLYLQHGGGEDERAWPIQGRASQILNNLIAANEAKPMLIVMERGYALRPGEEEIPFFPPRDPSAPPPSPDALMERLLKRMATFEDVVIEELIPLVDSTYRTVPDRNHRAIAGFSMGGLQAFMIGLHNLDTFAAIGGLSGAGSFGGAPIDPETYFGGVFSDAAAFNEKMDLIFLGHGSAEPERMMVGLTGYPRMLAELGIEHEYYVSEGTGHEWLTERRNLRELAKRLFK